MTPTSDRSWQRLGLSIVLSACAACTTTQEPPTLDEYLNRVGQLGSYDKGVARNAVEAIRSSPPEPTKAVLRSILQGDLPGNWSQLTRVRIAELLAKWRDETTREVDKTGMPELIEALRGPEASLREVASDTLPLFGADAVPFVADVLKSGGQPANRMEAAMVLGRIVKRTQNPTAGRALLKANLKDEESAEVRMAVMLCLAEWRNKQAAEGFIEALTDPDWQVRNFAWDRLKERTDPPLEFNPSDDFAARAEGIQKLRAWWRDKMKLR